MSNKFCQIQNLIIFKIFKYMKYLNILTSFQKYCFQETKKNAIMSHYRKIALFFLHHSKNWKINPRIYSAFLFLNFFPLLLCDSSFYLPRKN